MSTLNAVLLDNDHALVLVDTNISSGGEATKLFPIAHLGAIAAGRGRPAVLLSVVCGLATCRSFDDAVQNLEALFQQARTHVDCWEEAASPEAKAARAEVYSLFSEDDGDELLLVGWSNNANAVRAAKIKSRPGGEFDTDADLGFCVAPPHPGVIAAFEAKMPLSDTILRTMVRMQHELLAKQQPAAAAQGLPGYGGRLLLGRVTRGEVSVRDLGSL